MSRSTTWRTYPPLLAATACLVATAVAAPGTTTSLATMSTSRDTDGVPPTSYQQSFDKCDYLTYIQQELVGSHLTNIQNAKDGTDVAQARNAGYYALWTAYYLNLEQANDYSQCSNSTLDQIPFEVWTYDLINESTSHWAPPNGQTPPEVGPEELARAARTYWLLNREASGQPYPTTNHLSGPPLAAIKAWFLALEQARADTDGGFAPGAFARPLGEGVFLEACQMVITDPLEDPHRGGQSFAQRATDHWNAWHLEGDLVEDASNYLGLDASWITWWIDLKAQPSLYGDPTKMGKLAYRLRDYATPIGPMPFFGDGAGFAQNVGSYLGAFERWSVAYQDTTFSWVAQRMFQYALDRDSDLNGDFWGAGYRQVVMQGAMGAALAHTTTSIPASPPSTGSDLMLRKGVSWNDYVVNGEEATPRLILDSAQVPDKLVFRTGWGPSDTYAAFNLYPSAGHSHPEAGALVAYTSRDSVLLGGAAPYVNRDPSFHNTFTIVPEAELSETPDNFQAHQTGAQSPSFVVDDTSIAVTVEFDARSLEGSRFLAVRRSRGTLANAPELVVGLDNTWNHYTVELDVTPFAGDSNSHALMFSLVEDYQSDNVAKGSFLLDEVVVTHGPTQLGNWQFANNIDGFSDIDICVDHDGNPQTPCEGPDSAQHSHRVAASCLRTGYGGCLEVTLATNVFQKRRTSSVTVPTYAAHDDFGAATIHLEQHLGLPLTVDRHVLFLGHDGIWVKDVAEADMAFDGPVGPTWLLGDSKNTDALSQGAWYVGAQPAIPVLALNDNFLVHWTNRPKDLLVGFSSPGTTSHREDASTWDPGSRPNNAAWRIARRHTGQLSAGQRVYFNSLLLPHAPTATPERVADDITWLTDTEDLTVLEVARDFSLERIVAGFNRTGQSVAVPSLDATTDAVAFRFIVGATGIRSYDLVQATELLVDGQTLETASTPTDFHQRGTLSLAENASLETGTTGWTGYMEATQNPALIGHETSHTSGGSAGAIRWLDFSSGTRFSHRTGASAAIVPVAPYDRIEVEFDAKLLAPSTAHINVQRTVGGSGRMDLPGTTTWERYRVAFDTWYDTPEVIFAPVSPTASGPFPAVIDADLVLDNVEVHPIPNLGTNPDLEADITGWAALGGGTLLHETTDGALGSTSSVRGSLDPPGATKWYRHNNGITASTSLIPAHSRVRVGFWAKSLGGSQTLNVQRPFALTPGASVTLTTAWAYHSVAFDNFYETQSILFNTCDQSPCSVVSVVDGEFLLDNVVITIEPNRILNGSFDDDLHEWIGYVDGVAAESVTYWDAAEVLDVDIVPANSTSPIDTTVCASLRDPSVRHGDNHHITFTAQSLSGSPNVRVAHGGDSSVVQISTGSADYSVDLTGQLTELCFSTVLDAGSGSTTLASGAFTLDNVVVTSAP